MPTKKENNKKTPQQLALSVFKQINGLNIDAYNAFKRDLNRLVRQSTFIGKINE